MIPSLSSIQPQFVPSVIYQAHVFNQPKPAILFVVTSLVVAGFFEGPQNSDQEYRQFHCSTCVAVCSSVIHLLGNNLSIT